MLQSLVHNPLLRLYYLSELHTAGRCPISLAATAPRHGRTILYSDGLGGVTAEPLTPPQPAQERVAPVSFNVSEFSQGPCMSCSLDRIFGQMFCGEIMPFAPHEFLYNLWRSSSLLASYRQHDAHELFMSLCDLCHVAEKSNMQTLFSLDLKDETKCPCVMHRIFGGSLCSGGFPALCPCSSATRSLLLPSLTIRPIADVPPPAEIVCGTCGRPSAKHDPFFNISLEVPSSPTPPFPSSGTPEEVPEAVQTDSVSLHDCLQHFSQQELLSDVQCAKCNVPRQATKQLSLGTLPLSLCLHVKRFVQLPMNPRRSGNDL